MLNTEITESFAAYRKRMNDRILGTKSRVFQKTYNLDAEAYRPGALDEKNKELLGLCASLVLRCDDCVKYHIGRALETGASEAEIVETFEIATVVGGTIVIPHLRRGFEYLDACLAQQSSTKEV